MCKFSKFSFHYSVVQSISVPFDEIKKNTFFRLQFLINVAIATLSTRAMPVLDKTVWTEVNHKFLYLNGRAFIYLLNSRWSSTPGLVSSINRV